MPITMKLEIEKSTDHLKGTFSADATFMADGKSRVALSFGHSSIMEAVTTVIDMLVSMSPNATQKELDKYYKRWDEVPAL